MPVSAKARWTLYAIAAAFTAFALLRDEPQRHQDEPHVVRPATRAAGPVTSERAMGTPPDADLNLHVLASRSRAEPRSDLFAVPRVDVVRPQVPPPTFSPPPAPSAPPLPFKYLGMWEENGKTQVFLANGDEHHVVHRGSLIDQIYEIESIDEDTISVRHRPTGTRQVLARTDAPSADEGLDLYGYAQSDGYHREELN